VGYQDATAALIASGGGAEELREGFWGGKRAGVEKPGP